MRLTLVVAFGLLAVGCNLPFDTAPNTPAQSRKKTQENEMATDGRPAPSSPFLGHRFYFDAPLPDGWQVTARGEDQPMTPGYTALCVVSHRNGNDKVLFLLASSVDAAERAEVAKHMQDADWWQPRIPHSFFDANRVGGDTGLHVTKGQFANVDSLMVFAVLRCGRSSCEASLAQSHGFANRLQLRPARADDEHIVSPTAEDCGSRF